MTNDDGPRVRLRQPCPADAAARLALGRDLEIVRMVGGNTGHPLPPLAADEAARWLDGLSLHPRAWIVEHDGRLLGEARLDGLDGCGDETATRPASGQGINKAPRSGHRTPERLIGFPDAGVVARPRGSDRVRIAGWWRVRAGRKQGQAWSSPDRSSPAPSSRRWLNHTNRRRAA